MKQRPEFISIGMIFRPHGVKGEVKVIPTTDGLQQFEKLKLISIKKRHGKREFFKIEGARITTSKIILKLEGIDDRNNTLELLGLFIDKRFDECEELLPDEYYIFDLIGLQVKTIDNRWLGEVKEVLTLPANDVYVVKDGSNEYLIPAIKDVIKKVDLKKEIILIEPMDGLL